MKDAEQSRDARSGQRAAGEGSRTNEQTYAEPSRTQARECRQWESVGLPRGQRWSHNRTRKQCWERESGWASRTRESESNKRTNDTKAMNTPTNERTNECGERTNCERAHCIELKPVPSRSRSHSHSRCVCPTQSPSGSRCRCRRDASPQWTRLCLGAVGRRRYSYFSSATALPAHPLCGSRDTPFLFCLASSQHTICSWHETYGLDWLCLCPCPDTASSSLASASSSALPLAELCLWRALH